MAADNSKRVGFLMHGIFYGGASRSLYLLLKSLDRTKYKPIIYTIACSSDEVKKDFLKYAADIKYVKLPTISVNQVFKQSLFMFYKRRLANCRPFVEQIKADGIDILHINTTVFPQVPFWVKKYSNIKVITHIREWMPQHVHGIVSRYMLKRISEYSDALIAISDNEKDVFKAYSRNIYVMPNPFDFSNVINVKSYFRETYQVDKETVLITMAAHFSHSKGHINFLKALRHMVIGNYSDKKFLFIIIGYKDTRTWLKLLIKHLLLIKDHTTEVLKFISKNNLEAYVKLIPYTNNVFEIIQDSDIMVRPAKSADPWGRDIIEAMAFKKPVVAFGTSDFYIDEQTGFLVEPNNVKELAEKIAILANKPDLRNTFGARGYAKIKTMCDIEKYSDNIMKVYSSL